MKTVLILCTENSARSMIAEALINKYLNNIHAYSAGIETAGEMDSYAKEVLERDGAWQDEYYSKSFDRIMDIEFDLVVTICAEAEDCCPIFPKSTEVIHVGFDDPKEKGQEAYQTTFQEIKEKLLPIVRKKLS